LACQQRQIHSRQFRGSWNRWIRKYELTYSGGDLVDFYSSRSSTTNLTAVLEDSGNFILKDANSHSDEDYLMFIVFLMFLKLMRITFTADKDKFSTQEDEMRFSRWILSSNGGIIEEYSEGLFGGLPVMEIA
jgi:hypothetical protein